MVTVGLLVHLEAKPGKQEAIEDFLRSARLIVDQEAGTVAWFAFRISPTTYGIFDVFPSDEARQEHLLGRVASALKQNAPELFEDGMKGVKIEQVTVVSAKLPK